MDVSRRLWGLCCTDWFGWVGALLWLIDFYQMLLLVKFSLVVGTIQQIVKMMEHQETCSQGDHLFGWIPSCTREALCELTEEPCSSCCGQNWQQASGFVSMQSQAGLVLHRAENSLFPRLQPGCWEATAPCEKCLSLSSIGKEATRPLNKGRGLCWSQKGISCCL